MNNISGRKSYKIFQSAEPKNSGIYTFTRLLEDVLSHNDITYKSIPARDIESTPPRLDGSINIINLGVNTKEAAYWLAKNHGKSRNIIILHDLPVITNHLFTETLADTKISRFLSRLFFLKFQKISYPKLFSALDILVVTNSTAKEYLLKIRGRYQLKFKILEIPHPIYNPQCIKGKRINSSNPIRIGTFGHLNKLKSFSKIPIAIALIKEKRPDIFERITFFIRTQPNDSSGKKDFTLLNNLINSLNLLEKVIVGPSLPDNSIDDYIKSLDILILPYKRSAMMSSSGPAAYAMTYSKPLIGSGFVASSNKYTYPFDINSASSLFDAILDVVVFSEKWQRHLNTTASLSDEANWNSTSVKILSADLLCI